MSDDAQESAVFALPDFDICGVSIRDRVPYSISHSDLFARIVARRFVLRDPPDRTDMGEMDAFDFYIHTVKRIQMKYLLGEREERAAIILEVGNHLEQHPDSRVADYLRYAQQHPPCVDREAGSGLELEFFSSNPGGMPARKTRDSAVKEKKRQKKRKQKAAHQSRRANR